MILAAGAVGCESKPSASGSGSGAPVKASATAKAPEPAEEPRPTSPFELPGDPFSGAQKDPGESVEIPRARGYFVTAPRGFRIEKDAANGNVVLIPATGTGKVILSAEGAEAALEQRVTRFLQDSMTADATFQPEKDASIGVGGLAAKYALGVGYQGFPGGRREPHKLLRVRVATDSQEGKGMLLVQALAVWNGADVETEVAIVDAVKGIHRK